MRGLTLRSARLLALYGVRVRMIGACCTPFGIMITVYRRTPSRIGIISSRRSKSKPAVRGVNVAGISDGSAGGGGAGLAAGAAIRTAVAPRSAVDNARASRARRRGGVRMAAIVWNNDNAFDSGYINAASIFLGLDTPLGPLNFSYGFNDEREKALYLNLGKSF